MRKSTCKKTTCSCGKIIRLGSTCECKKEKRKKYMETYESDPLLNTYKWKKKRLQIIERDNGLCQRCLIKYGILNSEELQVHHIKSRRNFPELTFDDENLLCMCKTCNQQLGTKDKLDFNKDGLEIMEYYL